MPLPTEPTSAVYTIGGVGGEYQVTVTKSLPHFVRDVKEAVSDYIFLRDVGTNKIPVCLLRLYVNYGGEDPRRSLRVLHDREQIELALASRGATNKENVKRAYGLELVVLPSLCFAEQSAYAKVIVVPPGYEFLPGGSPAFPKPRTLAANDVRDEQDEQEGGGDADNEAAAGGTTLDEEADEQEVEGERAEEAGAGGDGSEGDEAPTTNTGTRRSRPKMKEMREHNAISWGACKETEQVQSYHTPDHGLNVVPMNFKINFLGGPSVERTTLDRHIEWIGSKDGADDPRLATLVCRALLETKKSVCVEKVLADIAELERWESSVSEEGDAALRKGRGDSGDVEEEKCDGAASGVKADAQEGIDSAERDQHCRNVALQHSLRAAGEVEKKPEVELLRREVSDTVDLLRPHFLPHLSDVEKRTGQPTGYCFEQFLTPPEKHPPGKQEESEKPRFWHDRERVKGLLRQLVLCNRGRCTPSTEEEKGSRTTNTILPVGRFSARNLNKTMDWGNNEVGRCYEYDMHELAAVIAEDERFQDAVNAKNVHGNTSSQQNVCWNPDNNWRFVANHLSVMAEKCYTDLHHGLGSTVKLFCERYGPEESRHAVCDQFSVGDRLDRLLDVSADLSGKIRYLARAGRALLANPCVSPSGVVYPWQSSSAVHSSRDEMKSDLPPDHPTLQLPPVGSIAAEQWAFDISYAWFTHPEVDPFVAVAKAQVGLEKQEQDDDALLEKEREEQARKMVECYRAHAVPVLRYLAVGWSWKKETPDTSQGGFYVLNQPFPWAGDRARIATGLRKCRAQQSRGDTNEFFARLTEPDTREAAILVTKGTEDGDPEAPEEEEEPSSTAASGKDRSNPGFYRFDGQILHANEEGTRHPKMHRVFAQGSEAEAMHYHWMILPGIAAERGLASGAWTQEMAIGTNTTSGTSAKNHDSRLFLLVEDQDSYSDFSAGAGCSISKSSSTRSRHSTSGAFCSSAPPKVTFRRIPVEKLLVAHARAHLLYYSCWAEKLCLALLRTPPADHTREVDDASRGKLAGLIAEDAGIGIPSGTVTEQVIVGLFLSGLFASAARALEVFLADLRVRSQQDENKEEYESKVVGTLKTQLRSHFEHRGSGDVLWYKDVFMGDADGGRGVRASASELPTREEMLERIMHEAPGLDHEDGAVDPLRIDWGVDVCSLPWFCREEVEGFFTVYDFAHEER
eukprot:g3407.t1